MLLSSRAPPFLGGFLMASHCALPFHLGASLKEKRKRRRTRTLLFLMNPFEAPANEALGSFQPAVPGPALPRADGCCRPREGAPGCCHSWAPGLGDTPGRCLGLCSPGDPLGAQHTVTVGGGGPAAGGLRGWPSWAVSMLCLHGWLLGARPHDVSDSTAGPGEP